MESIIGRALLALDLAPGNLGAKFLAQMKGAEAEADASSSRLATAVGGALKVASAAAIGVGAAALIGTGFSTKAAADFQQQMTLIRTQAGDTTDSVDYLTKSFMQMAPAVGIGPTELAQGFYHIASAGFVGAQAMQMLAASAQLSKVGQAELETTTQAVIGVMAAWGDQGMTAAKAVSYLNAIVGTGDMRMQGLASAMSTGILPAAATFGLGIQDVGAALATLTDNVTPPEEAATRLRMTFALLGAPSHAAAKALEAVGIGAEEAGAAVASRDAELAKYGITVNQLAADLHKPNGLLVAISDLKQHLKDLNPEEQAAVLSRAFGGGRSSAAILTLVNEFDRFSSKYSAQAKIAGQFTADWAQQQATFNQQMSAFEAALQASAITIGSALLPHATALLQQLTPIAGSLGNIVGLIQSVPQGLSNFLTPPKAAGSSDWLKALGAQGLAGMMRAGAGPMAAMSGQALRVAEAQRLSANAARAGSGEVLALGMANQRAAQQQQQLAIMTRQGIGPMMAHGLALQRVTTQQSAAQRAVQGIVRDLREFGGWLQGPGLAFLRSFANEHRKDFEQIRQTTQQIMTQLLQLVEAVLNDVKAFWAAHGTQVLAIVKAALTVLLDVVKGVMQLIADIIKVVLDVVRGNWKGAWEDLGNVVADFVRNVLNLLADLLPLVEAELQLLIPIVGNLAQGLWNAAVGLGQAIVDGIISGLRQQWDGLVSVLTGLAERLPDPIKKALGISSPSEVFAQDVGVPIGQGIALGVLDQQQQIADALTTVTSPPSDAAVRIHHHGGSHHGHGEGHHPSSDGLGSSEAVDLLRKIAKALGCDGPEDLITVDSQIRDDLCKGAPGAGATLDSGTAASLGMRNLLGAMAGDAEAARRRGGRGDYLVPV